jgi:hypothetical protein
LRDIKSGTDVAHQKTAAALGGDIPPGKQAPSAIASNNAPPSGQPGSEHDLGHGKDLTEEAERNNPAPSDEDFVAGEIGKGTSLVELFRAAGNDDPKARRAYQSAYQTAAPAALDAVAQERIPAGSRLLVRRYFESIRPKE